VGSAQLPLKGFPVRIRVVLAVTAAAFALTASPASATEGEFHYETVYGPGSIVDPPSRECVNIPEVEGTDDYAFRVQNSTFSTATVFKDEDCEGAYYSLRPQGKQTSERLLVRSVVFS
jgi:hypothetical protein